MPIMLVFLGAFMGAVFNFLMRKNIDGGGSTRAFLMLELIVAVMAVIILNPVRAHYYVWSNEIAGVGLIAGLFFGTLMWAQGKAVQKGPPGLIFAIVNSAAVFPAVIMAGLFGHDFGYVYTLWHGVGSLLVIGGLFWAGCGACRAKGFSWIPFSLIAFFSHILMLTFIQWRTLHLRPDLPPSELLLSLPVEEAASQWFLPMVFFGAAAMQIIFYLVKENRAPTHREVRFGFVGGIASACAIFFLTRATEEATGVQNAFLFPLSCVTVIVLCNLWGQFLYQERVNWWATLACVIGVFVATVNWAAL
ncbi:MAG: hypothetical protein JHC93_00750 [Parachlamydiales bacterium]|nr:hypothetical protein [Parachlamydiales bacterium]